MGIGDIAEYFLGTKLKRAYNQERDFYRENISNPERLRELLEISLAEQIKGVVYTHLPNVIDVGSGLVAVLTNTFPYGLFLGEGLRIFSITKRETAHSKIQGRMKTIKAALGKKGRWDGKWRI